MVSGISTAPGCLGTPSAELDAWPMMAKQRAARAYSAWMIDKRRSKMTLLLDLTPEPEPAPTHRTTALARGSSSTTTAPLSLVRFEDLSPDEKCVVMTLGSGTTADGRASRSFPASDVKLDGRPIGPRARQPSYS
jgi:hypothetical protein